eukprot:2942006-Rhodomonas_salina.1
MLADRQSYVAKVHEKLGKVEAPTRSLDLGEQSAFPPLRNSLLSLPPAPSRFAQPKPPPPPTSRDASSSSRGIHAVVADRGLNSVLRQHLHH